MFIYEPLNIPINEESRFSPVRQSPSEGLNKDRLTGVVVKNLPEALPDKEVELIVKAAGLDEKHLRKTTKFGGKMTVVINDLENKVCLEIIEKLDGMKVHDNKIYCKGLSELYTPEKKDGNSVDSNPVITPLGNKAAAPAVIPGLVITEPSKSQKKKEKRKKKSKENNKSVSDLLVTDFLKKSDQNAGDFIFSDHESINNDEDDEYNTCDYDSESDPNAPLGIKVAEVIASIEANDTKDPPFRERTSSTKRPGSPPKLDSKRRLKQKSPLTNH